MLNRIIIMGRLGKDPELRHTQQGTPVASFSLAVDRDFKDKGTGERVTDWIDVVAWRQTGEFVSRYFTKGRMAVVEGRLQMRDWNDRDGNKRRSAEVVADNVYFGDSKKDADGGGYQQGGYPQGDSYSQGGYPQGSHQQSGYGRGYGGAPTQGLPGYPASDYGGFQEVEEDDGAIPFNSNRPLHRRAGRPVLKGVNGYGKRTNRQHELLG